jgi:hypothetical protein
VVQADAFLKQVVPEAVVDGEDVFMLESEGKFVKVCRIHEEKAFESFRVLKEAFGLQ